MPHNINFREKRSKVRKERRADGGEDGVVIKSRVARFRFFEDISGYSGVRARFRPCHFTTCIVILKHEGHLSPDWSGNPYCLSIKGVLNATLV